VSQLEALLVVEESECQFHTYLKSQLTLPTSTRVFKRCWVASFNVQETIWAINEVTAFLRLDPTVSSLNDIIVGLVVLVSSLCIARVEPWQVWITAILGFWLIVAAFIPDLVSGVGLYLNNGIIGLIGMIVGLAMIAYAKKVVSYTTAQKYHDFRSYGSE